jgi:hypothetical protein
VQPHVEGERIRGEAAAGNHNNKRRFIMEEKKKAEGHGDNTAPAGIDSPGTFAPLASEPSSANQKSEQGKKGKE